METNRIIAIDAIGETTLCKTWGLWRGEIVLQMTSNGRKRWLDFQSPWCTRTTPNVNMVWYEQWLGPPRGGEKLIWMIIDNFLGKSEGTRDPPYTRHVEQSLQMMQWTPAKRSCRNAFKHIPSARGLRRWRVMRTCQLQTLMEHTCVGSC